MVSVSLPNLAFTALMPLDLFRGLFQQIDPIRANNLPKCMLGDQKFFTESQ